MESSSQLKRHYDELASAYTRWFEYIPQRPQYKGLMLIEYRMPSSAAFYMANEQIIVNKLRLPESFTSFQDPLKEHLGAENWPRWESLASEINNNIDSAVALWNEIEGNISSSARSAGLIRQSGPTDPVVDVFWPELFVNAIWRDSDYYAEKKVHAWEDARVVRSDTTIPQRHGYDVVQSWVFENTNMVRSQNKEPADAMKEAWAKEAMRAEPLIKNLLAERVQTDAKAQDFRAMLQSQVTSYAQTSRLPGACATCIAWAGVQNATSRLLTS